MKKYYFLGGAVMLVIALGIFWTFQHTAAPGSTPTDMMTREAAIGLVAAKYPELASYPSEALPPRTIISESSLEGWYLAFVQNGSGRPILSARCFKAVMDGTVVPSGEYIPHGEPEPLTISAKTCQ